MGLQEFYIQLVSNPRKTYVPGDPVAGRVVIVIDSNYSAQGVKVQIAGNEQVQWTETERVYHRHGSRNSVEYVTHTYSASETLFANEKVLAGDFRNTITFAPGRYEYPFRFILPAQLPASFSGAYGSIGYHIEAVIKRTWYKWNEKANSVPITVCGIYDLNANPESVQPREVTESKTVCCLCCASGPIVLVLQIPKVGYIPGEFIPTHIEIQNNSSRDIDSMELILKQVVTFFAQGRNRTVVNHVAVVERAGLAPNSTDMWEGNLITVPHVRPTTIGRHIIDVYYRLVAKAKISMAKNLEAGVPLIIGTVPLQRLESHQSHHRGHPRHPEAMLAK